MNNSFAPLQHLQPRSHTPDPRMIDPLYSQITQAHTTMEGQVPSARHHDLYVTPASYHEIPAHPYAQQNFAVNDVGTMRPQRSQMQKHTSDPRIVQAAYHQLMTVEANKQLSRAIRQGTPHLSPQIRMPTNRGAKRPFAETGLPEPRSRFQPPPQPRFIHHSQSAVYYPTMPMDHQTRASAIRSHMTASPPHEQSHPFQKGSEMRHFYRGHTQQAQQTQPMPFQYQNQPRMPQQTHTLNANSIPRQHMLGHRYTNGAQHEIPLQQFATDQLSISGAQYEGLSQRSVANAGDVAGTQHRSPSQELSSQQRVGTYLDQHPQIRDWTLQHRQELSLFIKFLQACGRASALTLPADSPQMRAELNTVIAIGHLLRMPMTLEQILTVQEDPATKRLAQQLLIFYEVQARMGRGTPTHIVAIWALRTCEQKGLHFSLPNSLLRAQVPFQPPQDPLQQQSIHSNSYVAIDLTDDDTVPVSRPSPQLLPSDPPLPTDSTGRNDGARAQGVLPLTALPTTDTLRSAPQPQDSQPSTPSTASPSWDKAMERSLLEAVAELNAQETKKLEQTTTNLPRAGRPPTEGLSEVATSRSIALATPASSLAPQVPSSPHSTALESPRPESPTPPALRADGWTRPEQISPAYRITPEAEVQATLTAALARGDAKESPANQDAGISNERTAAVHPAPAFAFSMSRQEEHAQLANFIPTPGLDLASPIIPPPEKQEQTFLDFKKRAQEAERKDREEPKEPKEAVRQVEDGWDGDVAGHPAMEGLFARMVSERQEREDAIWAGLPIAA